MDAPKAIAIPIVETIKIDDSTIQKVKTGFTYGIFGSVMLILFVVILYLVYSKPTHSDSNIVPKSLSQQELQTLLIVLALVVGVLFLLYALSPSIKELVRLFGSFKQVFILLIYLIALIVFYGTMNKSVINSLSLLFLPLTFFIGVFLFYRAIHSGPLYGRNMNIERIKYSLILFLFIVFMMLFYVANPGGYITKYFGPLLVLTILLVVFGFLYLITLMTLPSTTTKSGQTEQGVFKGLSSIGLFSGIGFLVFLIVVVAGIMAYPGGYIKNGESDRTAIAISLLVLLFVLWILFFGILSFTPGSIGLNTSENMKTVTNIAKQVLLLLFGLTFSGLLIGWIVTGVQNASTQSGTISFILNILIVITVLGLVYKMITGNPYFKKSAAFRLLVNSILYIPCILVNIVDAVGQPNVKDTPRSYYILLGLVIFLYILYYFIVPQTQTNIAKQGGTLLVNLPVYTDTEHILAGYDELNGTDATTTVYDYQYAISCWIFLDAFSPNISSSLDTYTSVLNYGGKPNILYNAKENVLRITMNVENQDSLIIYEIKDVLLQKWNNIIVNYSGGTIDVFYNGVLKKSRNGIVAKMSKDTFIIGSNNGVHGGICNVVYFPTSITASQIYYVYNSVKSKNPPVAGGGSKASIMKVITGTNQSYKPPTTTIIPIKIDVSTEPSGLEVSSDQPIKTDPNRYPYTDYLSFKWFAVANKDEFNGL